MQKVWGPVTDGKTPAAIETETLISIQNFLEQNGKPCCINLITEADNKFIRSLQEQGKRKESVDITEEEKQDVEEDLDEIDMMIRKEEEELIKSQ